MILRSLFEEEFAVFDIGLLGDSRVFEECFDLRPKNEVLFVLIII